MENYYEYISMICDDIIREREHWGDDDIIDLASAHADGSQLVIYYSQAHDFVQWLPSDIRSSAEDAVADCFGGQYIDYNDHASKIAYFALEQMILQELTERLDEQQVA